jgi:RNA polymerase sigma-70 factor (ECF subfamily)
MPFCRFSLSGALLYCYQPMPPSQVQADPVDDLTLVHQAKAGDLAAFSQLITRYEGKVFRLARHILHNQADAEDVLQNAFLKAYTHLDGFQENAKFYTWLVRIAVNESLMKLRKRKRGKTVSLDDPLDTGEEELPREIAVWEKTPEQEYSQTELRKLLDQAVDELAPIYRAVFLLRDVDGLSTEETAEALDLSIPAVKSRLLRARLKLREILTRFFKRKGDDVFAHL